MVDSFVTYGDNESKAIPYSLNSHHGIYFFVANGKAGTMAKKVVVK
jgi:hypothetical protein